MRLVHRQVEHSGGLSRACSARFVPAVKQGLSTRGFTLLELIAVMVLIGILTTLGLTRLRGLQERSEIDQAVLLLRDQVLRARHRAGSEQRAMRLRIDLDEHRYQLQGIALNGSEGEPEGGRWLAEHRQLGLRFIAADGTRAVDEGRVDLLFFPDRRCDGGGEFLFWNDRSARSLRVGTAEALPVIATIAVDEAEGG